MPVWRSTECGEHNFFASNLLLASNTFCMQINAHTNSRMHTYTCTYAYIHAHTCINMHIHAQTFILSHTRIFVCVCLAQTCEHMLTRMHPHARMHTCMQIRTHTCTYMHIRAHTCSNVHFIACYDFFECALHTYEHVPTHTTHAFTHRHGKHLQTIWLNCDTENSRYYAWGRMWHESFRQCTRDIPRAQPHTELTVSFK
jgi:hypothetical protein